MGPYERKRETGKVEDLLFFVTFNHNLTLPSISACTAVKAIETVDSRGLYEHKNISKASNIMFKS